VTGSGLRIRDWIRQLPELEVRSGHHTQRFLFRRKNESPAKLADFDEPLIERLVWIQENTESLIPMTVDLWEVVGCRRSMRRGSTTEALHMEVDASWSVANNGWRKFERAKGKMSSMAMRQLHTEMLQNLKHELNFHWRFRRRGPEGVIDCEFILSVLTYRVHLDNHRSLVLPNHLPYVLAHVWEVNFLVSGLPTPRITQSSEL
jgi:hypothetical protein